MQWLIDIIAARVIATIGIPPVYVWRGNQNDVDWDTGNITVDNQWRTIDMSSIVPADAVAVLLFTRCKNDSVGLGASWQYRRHEATHFQYTCVLRPQIAGIWIGGLFTVALVDTREVDYRFNGFDNGDVKIVVRGWWVGR